MSSRKKKQKPASERSGVTPLAKPNGFRYIAGFIIMAVVVAAGWFFHSRDVRTKVLDATENTGEHMGQTTAPVKVQTSLEDEKKVFAEYAGSSSCRECHLADYQAWQNSHHGLAERLPDAQRDKEAFSGGKAFKHGTQTTEVHEKNGKFEVVTLGFGNKREAYPVSRVIGEDPLRQFLVETTGGRLQTLEAAYDPHKKEWFNVYGDEDRRPGDWGHWTGRGMNWNNMCANCHNTRVRKNYDEATDSYRTTMAERTVSCEACHGPMKAHVEWRKLKPFTGQDDPTIKPVSREQMFHACAQCHSRRMELTGDFKPGDNYYDHHLLSVPDETDLFYPDGQVRDEDYEFTAFSGSRMHAAGVRCVDCHEPHSAKTVLPGNLLCLRCHNGSYPNSPVIDLAQHTFHKTESTGSQCVNCHMPQTTYMQRHVRHDHGFTIPDPLLTKEQGIPNACNRCHTDKNVDWALLAVEKWYGPKMERPYRQRAKLMAAAKNGDDFARDQLLKFLQGDDQGFWKGVAANMLERWVSEPTVETALGELLKHPDPVARANAAQTLGVAASQPGTGGEYARQLLRGSLTDSSRSVRYTAAWALMRTLDPGSLAARELKETLAYNADQPMGQLQKGNYELARQNINGALPYFAKAVEWDSGSAGIHQEYATVLSMAGRPEETVKQMFAAVQLEPQNADHRYRLALALNEAGRLQEAMQSLEDTVRLNPRHARAWYNLGLARNQTGQADRAVDALLRGEQASPDDAEIPYALATVFLRQGRTQEAKAAAERALRIAPGYGAARQLLDSLNAGK